MWQVKKYKMFKYIADEADITVWKKLICKSVKEIIFNFKRVCVDGKFCICDENC